jgi:hypothetical protein
MVVVVVVKGSDQGVGLRTETGLAPSTRALIKVRSVRVSVVEEIQEQEREQQER